MADPQPALSRSERLLARYITDLILYHLGQLSAVVPRGELRDLTDDTTERAAALAEAIGRTKVRDD